MKKQQLLKYNKEYQQFQQLLLEYELDIFTFKELVEIKAFREFDVQQTLEVLVKSNFLKRIEKGKYCMFNFSDEYVIASKLVSDGVIAYWSALNLHGLTEQFSTTVFVQTTKLKRAKTVFGVPYQFVKILPRKKLGIITQGYGNHQYYVTDPEKTIVDCFDLPQYSGGWAELMRAVGEGNFDQYKFIEYCKAVKNIAATKRLAFIIELLELPNMVNFLSFAKTMIRQKYNVFDPFGKDEGSFDKRWKLRLNIPKKDILSILEKTY
ncbi:MAG: hypothetical protein AAF688_12990 [Bacteroidota bacterium]